VEGAWPALSAVDERDVGMSVSTRMWSPIRAPCPIRPGGSIERTAVDRRGGVDRGAGDVGGSPWEATSAGRDDYGSRMGTFARVGAHAVARMVSQETATAARRRNRAAASAPSSSRPVRLSQPQPAPPVPDLGPFPPPTLHSELLAYGAPALPAGWSYDERLRPEHELVVVDAAGVVRRRVPIGPLPVHPPDLAGQLRELAAPRPQATAPRSLADLSRADRARGWGAVLLFFLVAALIGAFLGLAVH
jgi:hypothetical protein